MTRYSKIKKTETKKQSTYYNITGALSTLRRE